MEQKLSSIQNSLVEEISSSKNEPQWLKEYRKNSLNIYNELPAEVGIVKYNQIPNLYTIIGLTLIIAGVAIVNLFGIKE